MKRRLVLGSLVGVLTGALLMAPVSAQAQEVRAQLNDGSTLLTLDRGAVQALAAAEIDVSTSDPATGPTLGGALSFPVTGGTVESASAEEDPTGGNITHSGELVLTRGDQQIVLSEFDIVLGGPLTALVDGERIPFLAGTPGTYDTDGETLFLFLDFGTTLTPEAADALNDTFDTSTFAEGFLFATADTTATTR